MRRLSIPLSGLLVVLLVALLATSSVQARSIVPLPRDRPRDLFDQMLHSLAAKYLPQYQFGGEVDPFSSTSGKSVQWSVHPLPRKRQLNLSPGGAGDDDTPSVSGLGGVTGGGGGNAIPASVLAAAAVTGTASQTPASGSTMSSASASATPASATGGSTSSSSPTSATPSSSPSAIPLSKLLTTATSSSSTNTSQPDHPSASLLSPKNKLFPLTVAGLACAGLVALMLLISVFRCIAHDQLRRDNLRKSYAFDESPTSSSKRNDKFTAPNAGVGTARSLRRALTKKKLGSFARRTQEGSVLVEVGDEVFAVPAHLADGYREKVLRERREKMGGGMWGNVKPRHLNDGGPDEEEARAKYDAMLDGEDGGVKRTLSQRLGDRLRAFTSLPVVQEKEGEKTFSFDTEGQTRGEVRQADISKTGPAITTGGSAWTIQPSPIHQRTSSIPPPPPQVKQVSRKPAPQLSLTLLTEKLADLEKQSSSASSSSHNPPPTSSTISHNRLSTSSTGTFGPHPSSTSIPGALPDRSKSLHRNRTVKPLLLSQPEVGGYRHRSPAATRAKTQGHARKTLDPKPTSVPLASPTRFAPGRQLVVHPQTPPAAAIRPLPVPPPFNPKKSFT